MDNVIRSELLYLDFSLVFGLHTYRADALGVHQTEHFLKPLNTTVTHHVIALYAIHDVHK